MSHNGVVILHKEIGDFWANKIINSTLNTIAIHPAGGKNSEQSMWETISIIETDEYKKFKNDIHSAGIDIEFEAHAHSWLLQKSLFAEHPDWFRVNESGERDNDINMCFTNTEALAEIEKRAQVLSSYLVPTTNRYFFWSDDVGENAFCNCPECKKLSYSDQYMLWCNAVLKGIKKTNPKAQLSYLAYVTTLAPPTKVKPDKGIFLEYAPFLRDSYIEINNVNCEINRKETKTLKDLLEFFGREDSQVLEYWLDNTRFSGFKEPYRKFQFDTEIMRRDVEYYKNLGFENMTCFACAIDENYAKRYGDLDISEYSKILNLEKVQRN